MIKIEFLNIKSSINIKDSFVYKNFEFIIDDSGYALNLGDVLYKPIKKIIVSVQENSKMIIFLNKYDSTSLVNNLFLVAKQDLDLLFYKFSLRFCAGIYLDYPYYFQIDSKVYQHTNNSFSEELKNNAELPKDCTVYKSYVYSNINLDWKDPNILDSISDNLLNLGYFTYCVQNNSLDINFRALSAWKYLEEYLKLNYPYQKDYKERQIPEKLFRFVFKNTEKVFCEVAGKESDTGKLALDEYVYNQSFFDEFYSNIRLVIAHHERDSKKPTNYIPSVDLIRDLLVKRNFNYFKDFILLLNQEMFLKIKIDYSNIGTKNTINVKFQDKLL